MGQELGPSHDAQRFRSRNQVALGVVFLAVLLLAGRVVIVQAVGGERYEKYATIERVTKIRAQAARGLVKAADGSILARNIESHSLEIMTHLVKQERVTGIASTLRELLDMTDAEYDGLIAELNRPVDSRKKRPLVVRRDLVSTHCPYDSSQLELVSQLDYGFCAICGRYFQPVPAKKTCPFDQRKLVAANNGGMRCPSCERDFTNAESCSYDNHLIHHGKHILKCPLCARTFNDEVAVLRANLHRLPEARIQTEIQREYPFRFLASHILGYMGYVERLVLEPLVPFSSPRYGLNDRVGRFGLEKYFDLVLRGIDGEQVLVKRSGNEEQARDLDELTNALQPRPTVPGHSIRLTLDMELQRTTKVAMKDVYSGAAVVLNAKTGEILALYSKPSFDPNTLSGRRTPQSKTEHDIAAYAPLLDKAVHPFPPASTFKVVAAVAALETGLINAQTTFHCPGYYDFGGRRFHCHSKRGHGDMNVAQALRASCDVFFYHMGELLQLDKIEKYARMLGFAEATGIELSESKGRIPTRQWYVEHVKGGYYPGFALSTAVGQKDVTATPLQLARVYMALGNGGFLQPVSLVAGFESADGKFTPKLHVPAHDMGFKASTINLVRNALRSVVNEQGGTAFSAQPMNVTMAGKTGTAQAAQRARADVIERLKPDPPALNRLVNWLQNDHAWFVGYAPADEPEITVAVLVEHGGSGGHNAAPIAKQIVETWFSKHPLLQKAAPPAAKARKKAAETAEPAADEPEDEVPVHDPEAAPTVPDEPQPVAEPTEGGDGAAP